MIPDHYVWFLWACAFLVPWLLLFFFYPKQRKIMAWASVFTLPFGLTEPLFAPAYWNPPSLFNLAPTTGFDIESFVFSFAIGGVAAALYNVFTGNVEQPLSEKGKRTQLHWQHILALLFPFAVFAVLFFLHWNPIYPSIIAMITGALTTVASRPDLKTKTWIGGVLFLAYYVIFLRGLEWVSPGYIQRVWNLAALSGISIWRMPLEELLFSIGFGMYWSGAYEHLNWTKSSPPPSIRPRP